ncbi:MAG: cysteine-rich small domain-containing protein [Eubacteriaceae bacterium]
MKVETEEFKFFQHTKCEYFPCHEGIPTEEFNCLFCYCPLYALGKECGGNFVFTKEGVKNCSHCSFPHIKKNYDSLLENILLLIEQVKEI